MGAIINTHAHEGLGLERRPHRRPSYLSQASCVIVSRPVYSSAGLGYISPYVKDIHLVFNHTCKYVNKTLTVLLNEVLLLVLQLHFSCTPRRRLGL